MKYKIGDKVRVRKDLEENKVYGKENKESFVDTMINYKGKILTIKSIKESGYLVKETTYYWVDEMFESKVNDKVIFNGNATILIKDGKKYVSKCYGEEFDKEKGLLMCLAKANGISYMDLQDMLNNAIGENKHTKEKKYKITLKEFWNSKEKLAIHCEKKEDLKKLFDTMKEKGFYVKGKEDNFCKNIPYIENNKNMDCVNILQTVLVAGYKVYEFEDVDLGE